MGVPVLVSQPVRLGKYEIFSVDGVSPTPPQALPPRVLSPISYYVAIGTWSITLQVAGRVKVDTRPDRQSGRGSHGLSFPPSSRGRKEKNDWLAFERYAGIDGHLLSLLPVLS